MKAGADLTIANNNQDLPLDMAIRWGQDAIVLSLIDPERKRQPVAMDIQDQGQDPYRKALSEAREQRDYAAEVFIMVKITDQCLQKNEYERASLLASAALTLAHTKKLPDACTSYLLAKLQSIIGHFVNDVCKRKMSASHVNRLTDYRKRLAAARQWVADSLANDDPEKVLALLTEDYRKLFQEILEEALELLGDPPAAHACVGLGSLAQGQMFRNTSLQWAILIDEESDLNLNYFGKFARLVQLMVTGLGETPGELFEKESLDVAGFACDETLAPLGDLNLIGTPNSLAGLLSKQEDPLLADALVCATLLSGSKKLLNSYHKKVATAIDGKAVSLVLSDPRRALAHAWIKHGTNDFHPQFTEGNWSTAIEIFDLRRQLLAPLEEMIAGLALYYKLKSKSTLGRIEELAKRKLLTVDEVNPLTKALQRIFYLVIKTHSFYEGRNECLYFSHLSKKSLLTHGVERKLKVSEEEVEQIEEIYRMLAPFHKKAQRILTLSVPRTSKSSRGSQRGEKTRKGFRK
jgi:Putative nucleotidyltransferase substrate binding domain